MKDETLLIQKAKGGDTAAFSALVRHYYQLMRFVAAPIVGESHADEIVQEAWLTVYQKLADWEQRGSFKSWLLTITANEAKNLYRKQKREVLSETPEEHVMNDRFRQDGHWAGAPATWHTAGPEALLSNDELLECLNRKVKTIPEKQRIVFGLKNYSLFSLDEIADFMGESSANVRVLLHRARTKLYKDIESFQESGIC